MRKLIMAAAAVLMMGAAAPAFAQTTTTVAGSNSDSFAAVINQVGPNGGGGGGGGGGVGYLNTNNSGTIWTLGGTPSMAATSYDACTKYVSGSAILAGVNIPLEIEQCWSMRMADAIAKYPPGSVQYNLLCNDSNVLRNDWQTNTMKCTANIAKLPKTDPRSAGYTGIPVVAVQGPGIPQQRATVQNAVPPNGVNIAAPNAQPNLSQVSAPQGREVCMNTAGAIVPAGTRGASCGFVGS